MTYTTAGLAKYDQQLAKEISCNNHLVCKQNVIK